MPGLLSAKNGQIFRNIQKSVKESGYHMELKTLNAHDFGVLQQRRRVILIGWPKKKSFEYPEFTTVGNGYLVKQLFSDLPTLKPAEDGSKNGYVEKAADYLSLKKIRTSNDVLTQHVTRPHNELAAKEHRERKVLESAFLCGLCVLSWFAVKSLDAGFLMLDAGDGSRTMKDVG